MTWLDKKPILALAPMADLTDSPFCRVCREVSKTNPSAPLGHLPFVRGGQTLPPPYEGGVAPHLRGRGGFVIFREMVSAEAVARGNKKTLKMCEFDEIEKPIVLQLFGSEPEVMARAGKILVEANIPPHPPFSRGGLRPDGIDINMGCPVPRICGAGKGRSGAFLMKDHETAIDIIKALKKANLGLPITVKTRLGWSKNSEILDFAPKLEQAGADAITIHGRTKIQGYSGKADWEMIGKVKKLVSIPIIANGDIDTSEDIEKCLEITGADGVMIGRAALGNPWIFNYVRTTNKYEITNCELVRVVMRHAELHLEHYGEKHGLKTFRKHLLYYFKNFPNAKELRRELVKVNDFEDLKKILKNIGY